MDIKIFISHKREDELVALSIQKVLAKQGIGVYLDILDESLVGNGEKLTKHIKAQLEKCTDIIVVLSSRTYESWWVPFEIGMATESNKAIANYFVESGSLPDFLEYWPRLKAEDDLIQYVEVRRKVHQDILRERRTLYEGYSNEIVDTASEINRFYRELKKKL